MCDLELEPCEVWVESPVVARKAHECDACNSAIAPGEPYLTHFHVFEGDAEREKMCFLCWWAREVFVAQHDSSMSPANLIHTLRECLINNDDDDDEWRPVLAGVLRRWRVSSSRRRQERARVVRRRRTINEAQRRWPGHSDVIVTSDGSEARFLFPGGKYRVTWYVDIDEFSVGAVDVLAWHDFDRHSKAARV